MNVLLLTSHSIAEYDDLRMLTDLGYDVFSIGAYTDPSSPTDDKRPALPNAPYFPELAARCDEQRQRHANDDARFVIDWAKGDLHPDLIDWADAIIVHHFPEAWIVAQWPRFKGRRVIWRTCGQSSPDGSLERLMAPLVPQGLEIVRYSPREMAIPGFAGESALIRFGKYPGDYAPWIGDDLVVGNVTQHMAQRGDACGYGFWMDATAGLPTKPAGPGSEVLPGGIGGLGYAEMLDYLRHVRVYLYTGTQPASYTLGLMEAMLAGVPVVSIRPEQFGWAADLFEGHTMAQWSSSTPEGAKSLLRYQLEQKLWDPPTQDGWHNQNARARAVELFGVEMVGAHWKAFLG
jgi:hypothetical protein